jgi:tripartite ATP-independent transporter DctP family solute receptor
MPWVCSPEANQKEETKMKRIFLIAVVALLVTSLLPGICAAQKKIIVRLGDVIAESDPQFKAMELFKKLMAEKTNGQVEVRLFPNSQLGDQRTMLEMAQQGNIEMVKTSNAVLSGFTPKMQILDFPYIFGDRDRAVRVINSDIVQGFVKEDMAKAGFKVLLFFDPRTRSIYNSKRPIYKLEDMKGMKIRVQQSPVMIDTINALGGQGVPMAFGEVYSALQQGVVDGAENSLNYYFTQKHHEVCKFFSNTEQFTSPELIVISKKWFDNLPKNVQDAIYQTPQEMYKLEIEVRTKLLDDISKQLGEKGVKVNNVELEPFKKAAQVVYDKHANVVGGKEVIQKVLAIK